MRVLHVIPYLGRNQGGPVLSLAGYAQGLVQHGVQVDVLHGQHPHDGETVQLPPHVSVMAVPLWPCLGLRWAPALTGRHGPAVATCDLVHLHGLWTDLHRRAALLARQYRKPLVVSLCGMLQPRALRYRGLKKRLVWWWFQHDILAQAAGIHAKSIQEAEDAQAFGARWPARVIPNPVDQPSAETIRQADAARARWELPGGYRYLLYLGRLHPVKGIAQLIDAVCALSTVAGGIPWRLLVAGPDEGHLREGLVRKLREQGCAERVLWLGSVNEVEKWALLDLAACLVAPSLFENFGLAIAEALMAGKPVVTTTGTPWNTLVTARAGWQVAPTAPALAAALRDMLALDDEQLAAMGARGRCLVEPFGITAVGAQLKDWYGEIVESPL